MNRKFILFLILFTLSACKDPVKQEEITSRSVKIVSVESCRYEMFKKFSGSVEATEETELSFQVDGKLKEFSVLEGQIVRKGEVLAELDETDFKRAVKETEVRLHQLKKEYLRKQELFKNGGFASRSTLDDAETEFELQKLALSEAKQNLGYTKILAPFDLVVAKRYVSNFKNVTIGEPVVLVQDMTSVDISIAVSESVAASAINTEGYDAYAVFPFAPDKKYHVAYKEHVTSPDSATQTYQVIFTMPRPDGLRILPGMSVNIVVKVREEKYEDCIEIPATAIVSGEDGELFVWVVTDNGTISRRNIETEGLLGEVVVIKKGLDIGENIVAAGGAFLREGEKVHQMNLE